MPDDPAPAVTHGLRSITCVVTCVEVAQFAVAEDDRPERSISPFDEAGYDKAVGLAGWKGYVTNTAVDVMSANDVVGSYHDLWHVEQSFRMSKTDLRARPIFHRTRDAIEAHLTVVFTALAVSRFMQEATGWSLKKTVTTMRPLREFVGEIDGHELVFPPELPPSAAKLIENVENFGPVPGH